MKTIYHHFKNFLTFSILLCIGKMAAQPTVQTFSYTGSIVQWTVPSCVSIMTIETRGAQGGCNGGLGARMIGTFTVQAGQVLKVLVAQQGSVAPNQVGNGGGGGSFVTLLNNTPLCIAGGGGGTAHNCTTGNWAQMHAPVTTSGQPGQYVGSGGSLGGVNGNGGFESYTTQNIPNGGGGGGLLTSGGTAGAAIGGTAFILGGNGGNSTGGFGGGGGSNSFIYGCGSSPHGGSGGGGYSGGGAGGSNCNGAGGGGGSFNAGTNQSNTAGYQSGDGLVIFTYALNGNGVVSSATPSLICLGQSATLTASGNNSYTWSTGAQTASTVVTPTATTSYTVLGTNSVNCVSNAVLTVTVNTGLPVLSVNVSTNNLCYGKTATLTASGAINYTWTSGVINGVSYTPSVTTTYTVIGQNGCGTTSAVTTITVAPLSVTVSASPGTICAGSPVALSAAAAATLFTWQPFTGTLTGANVVLNPSVTTIYTVTASDGTCGGVATVTVTANPVPTISLVPSSTLVCEGYPVVLTANGGVSYTWTPTNPAVNTITVYPTAPTLYSVTGSNNLGCKTGTSVAIITMASPTVVVTSNSAAVCPGGAVTLSASGAASYAWTGGPPTANYAVTPAATTIYTVVGMDGNNNCSNTKTISITVFSPQFSVSGTPTICSGSSATLSANGADSFLWDNNQNVPLIVVSPTVSSTYTVTGTTSSLGITCSSTKTIQVLVNALPTVVATPGNSVICKGEKTTILATGATSYVWVPAATGNTVSATSTVPTNLNFTVTGTDQAGCSNTVAVTVKVNPCNGITQQTKNGESFSLYPNPNKGEFNITSTAETTLLIHNELGQLVHTVILNKENSYGAKLNNISSGIYFISEEANPSVHAKIVVAK